MGYLDNSSITVDAILTKKGRELLAKGTGFQITQFAVADDEVDYSLYNPGHPLGTEYYGNTIEKMPVLEASPDETQVMRFKLVSLPRGTNQIPVITVSVTSIDMTYNISGPVPIGPNTSQQLNGSGYGYTAILYDSNAATLTGMGLSNTSATIPFLLSDQISANATVARGTDFTLQARNVPALTTTTLVIVGNQTGASISIPVTVRPQPTV